jgi:polygalacturonase
MKLLSTILFLVCCTGIAKADTVLNPTDQNGINQALEVGGTIYLNPGVYEVTGTINIHSNTILTGSPDAIIRVSSSSSQYFTGSTGIITCTDPQNIEVSNIQIDGNLENLSHSYNSNDQDPHDCERAIFIIGPSTERGNNITISNLKIFDTFSDGVHVRYCDNVQVSNLEESDCQHEGIYFCEDFDGAISGCHIAGITSDCLRVENCKNVLVHDNLLYSYSGSNNNGAYEHGEAGLQVGNQGRSFGTGSPKPDSIQDIEIYNNTFANDG